MALGVSPAEMKNIRGVDSKSLAGETTAAHRKVDIG
jgi:hypothetical protein